MLRDQHRPKPHRLQVCYTRIKTQTSLAWPTLPFDFLRGERAPYSRIKMRKIATTKTTITSLPFIIKPQQISSTLIQYHRTVCFNQKSLNRMFKTTSFFTKSIYSTSKQYHELRLSYLRPFISRSN